MNTSTPAHVIWEIVENQMSGSRNRRRRRTLYKLVVGNIQFIKDTIELY